MQFALLLLLLVSAPAADQTPSGAEGAAANPAAQQPVEEKKICKRTPASESRMAAKRLCMTAEQWKKHQREQF